MKQYASFPMIIIDANGDYLNHSKYIESKGMKIEPQLKPVGWIKSIRIPPYSTL